MKKKKGSKLSKKLSVFLIFVIVLLSGLIALKSNLRLRDFVYRNVFQNNLKFAKINELYEKYFGSALPLTGSEDASMVSSDKIDYSNLEEYKDGVKLKVTKDYTVGAFKSGIVIFVGEKEGYGNTVIIEDADGVDIWHSNLKDIKVGMYDYLKKGSIIGQCDDELVMAFTKDGKKVDYKKYF